MDITGICYWLGHHELTHEDAASVISAVASGLKARMERFGETPESITDTLEALDQAHDYHDDKHKAEFAVESETRDLFADYAAFARETGAAEALRGGVR